MRRRTTYPKMKKLKISNTNYQHTKLLLPTNNKTDNYIIFFMQEEHSFMLIFIYNTYLEIREVYLLLSSSD
jgi:hypothetical protein